MTGATGFVGSHLVHRLLRDGHRVGVLLRDTSDAWRIEDTLTSLAIVNGDLANVAESAEAIRQFRPQVVVHLAWTGAGSRRHQNDTDQVFANVPGSLSLVRLAAECGCEAWLGMGSVLEYGEYEVPVTEADRTEPKSLYGAAKLSTGLLASALCRHYSMRFAWFRLFWAYGPGDDGARMIPYLLLSLLRGERPALTPCEQIWDYLYIDDVVDAVLRVALRSEAEGCFNLGSGTPQRLRDVAAGIRDLVDPSLPVGFGDLPYRDDQIMHLRADVARLHRLVDWHPEVSLAVGLARTAGWFRENLDRYALRTGG